MRSSYLRLRDLNNMNKDPFAYIDRTLPFASGGASAQVPEVDDAFKAWKASDTPQTRSALLSHVKPIISTALHSYGGTGNPVMQGQAKLMALKAFKTFDPNRGNLKTHLLSQLQGLQRANAQSNQIISIPERVAMDRKHLAEAENQMQDELGRPASTMELANRTGMSLKRINYVRQGHVPVNTGSILDEEGDVYSPASQIPGSTPAEEGWHEMVYHDLGDIDKVIMERTLGLHGMKPIGTGELAAQLNLSPGAISQRKMKIQRMLDERFEINPFGAQ